MDGSRGRPSGRRSRLQIAIVLPAGVRAPGLRSWLISVAPARARGVATIAVVSDQRIRQLNRTYRHTDKVTDVLSFPAQDSGAELVRSAQARLTSVAPRELGDIVIAAGAARRQARDAGHSLQRELKVLALHGLLHLLGYDHEHDDGRMARLEQRLRRRGGLREGLIERGTQSTHGAR